jgi:hypothetical protein
MLEELRMDPRARVARSEASRVGVDAGAEGGTVGPDLSTGFAEGDRLRSTGALYAIHRVWCGEEKEEVG